MRTISIYLMIFLLGFASCSKDLESVNDNPNNPTKVEPDFLLTTAIFETMNLYGGPMNRVVFFNYTHHFSGFQGEFQRYTYGVDDNNTYWKNTYIRCLQPVNQIELNYKNNPSYTNRVLIARIWKDFILSNTVSIWGSIPADGALAGTPSVPYTKEQDVYTALLADLKVLADSLNVTGDKYTVIADKVFGGDVLKWKKFANSLRLRLAMRISNADAVLAQKVVAEIYQDEQNTMKLQAETAAATWGSTSDTWSPLYDRVVYNYTANKATIPVVNESLIYHMAPYNDPRLAVYAQPAKQGPQIGKYFGQNISYGGGGAYANGLTNPHTGLKQDDYSYIGERFLKPDAEYVFLSYAETCFLKAEAALKGWWGDASQAAQYYNEGIDASLGRYGLTAQAAAYKNTPGIKWGTASDTTGRSAAFEDWLQICSSYVPAGDNYRQIIMQEWLAIPGQGVDAWALIRRSRILEFEPQFATYDGNYAYVPDRLLYPATELQINAKEVQKAIPWLNGPDNLFTKLWFALPNKKNPFLPY
ncbi:SusD/RagB family nutrient-binding outer membrane lipoprotein [Chitinophaga sp. SYP-B3965]|uniref:SusD/RagB family nutrient-binding outer membrane lipoprotein n=1 Tax=Chitinophaga sp. SYP-B3965 TaxID=2663120 RepID=UPI001299DA4F|nr:SusD/RagB family nutrient-binding outer membrane lipoprotein [Chitinophaga sp. SYP-B3965]MRG43814.1 SusD/RagB family nutrient-binding outer membrane lipoprotein [Chitinophaga sp. SYP-B3965]